MTKNFFISFNTSKAAFSLALAMLFSVPQGLAQNEAALPEVQTLRQERELKMPYLDKSFIRSEINGDKIQGKINFLTGPEKNLQQLVDRAIASYTPARAAKERISLARRRILAAFRSLFPEAAYEQNLKNGDLSDVNFDSFNYRFKFRQPIFRGGILWNTLLQEKEGLEAAEKEYAAALEDVVSEVATAYFEYNRSLSVIQTQEKTVTQFEQYVTISEKKYKEEMISEIEHLNVQSLYSQMKYEHETSKQELELARLDLQKLLGLDLDDNVRVASVYDIEQMIEKRRSSVNESIAADRAGKADRASKKDSSGNPKAEDSRSNSEEREASIATSLRAATLGQNEDDDATFDFQETKKILNLGQLVDMAYLNRPELQVEAAKLESARLEERIRWGNFLPQADAVLEFGKLGEAFTEVSEDASLQREFRFSLEFNWNLAGNKIGYTLDTDQRAATVSQFQGGGGSNTRRNTFSVGLLDSLKDYVDTKEAEVARLDQVAQLEKKEKEIIQDVKKSFFDYQKSKIQVKSSLQRVDYRQRLAQLQKHKLEKNEIQVSEYLQAEIDLEQEVMTLHKALADYNTAKAKLNHAVGVRGFLPLGMDQYGRKPEA